jgi:hypothetical protein
MRRKLAIVVFSLCFIAGCSQEQTFDHFFHGKMESMHIGEVDYTYELIQKEFNVVHENDAIAIFKENSEGKEKIFIAYFEKMDDQWQWIQTLGSEWNSPVKWSSMTQPPYIYSGAINDHSITEVYAGDEPAKIINVEDDKRFWYAISPTSDVEVTLIKDNGSKEMIEEINDQELQGN